MRAVAAPPATAPSRPPQHRPASPPVPRPPRRPCYACAAPFCRPRRWQARRRPHPAVAAAPQVAAARRHPPPLRRHRQRPHRRMPPSLRHRQPRSRQQQPQRPPLASRRLCCHGHFRRRPPCAQSMIARWRQPGWRLDRRQGRWHAAPRDWSSRARRLGRRRKSLRAAPRSRRWYCCRWCLDSRWLGLRWPRWAQALPCPCLRCRPPACPCCAWTCRPAPSSSAAAAACCCSRGRPVRR
mmetsp:Transcript_70821/g.188396  ORF Transcript_70821/g.188396 Transcript_70821/m.188396 type:complete len:239 (+) Transcript_70821:996-1712(+)